jgi:hypothetical protein
MLLQTMLKEKLRMKKKKLTRKMKIERNKSGKMSDNSTYAKKIQKQRRGIFSQNSPFKGS